MLTHRQLAETQTPPKSELLRTVTQAGQPCAFAVGGDSVAFRVDYLGRPLLAITVSGQEFRSEAIFSEMDCLAEKLKLEDPATAEARYRAVCEALCQAFLAGVGRTATGFSDWP